MAAETTSRWRLGLLAAAFVALGTASGFMACASSETIFSDPSGAGGAGAAGGGNGPCNVALCPEPMFTGLEKCCTTDGMCGVRSGAAAACYPPGQGSGVGGMGGMGGGKL